MRSVNPDRIWEDAFPAAQAAPLPFGLECGFPTPNPPDLALSPPWQQAIDCLDPNALPNVSCLDNWGLDRIGQNAIPRDGLYDFGYLESTGGNGAVGTGRGVHVYVFDTLVFQDHQDLQGHFGNGHDAVGDTSCSATLHGTMVSALIGGSTYGVAKEAILHSVRVGDCAGAVTDETLLEGLHWIALNHQPPAVVNISLNLRTATGYNLVEFSNGVRSLILDHGITVVNSAGNYNTNHCTTSSPSDVDEVVVAGATQMTDGGGEGRWVKYPGSSGPEYGSNLGSCIDVWAPGANVISASIDHAAEGCRWTGTSFSAPLVTAQVALLLEELPDATPAEIEHLVKVTAVCDRLPESGPNSIHHPPYDSPNRLLQISTIPLRLRRLPTEPCGEL